MASPVSSSPSEGEIFESGSEKATTAFISREGTIVDPPFRKRVSVSRSSSSVRSPGNVKSRSASRSPFREARGTKRALEDEHNNHSRNDPRRFRICYEDRPLRFATDQCNSHRNFKRVDRSNKRLGHEEPSTGGLIGGGWQGQRSRSPRHRKSLQSKHEWRQGRGVAKHEERNHYLEQGFRGFDESTSKLSKAQSVSDRGCSPVAAARLKKDAKSKPNQTQITYHATGDKNSSAANLDSELTLSLSETTQTLIAPPADEMSTIEERRKRREAIKAKHRGQSTPMIAQALALENLPMPPTPSFAVEEEKRVPVSPRDSPLTVPKDLLGQESPSDFEILKDIDLANSSIATNELIQEDGPSAADYDPIMDMQEDKIRHNRHQQEERGSSHPHDETKSANPNTPSPDINIDDPKLQKAEEGLDMFAEADDLDMFAENPTIPQKALQEVKKAAPVLQAKALDMSMLDDWDDPDGYYRVILGELLDNRYHIQSNLGKGMFSGVVRAMDQRTKRLVAIKIIRNNETMRKAGLKEIEILSKLSQADPEDKKHIIRLERFFEHKDHLCMVFENLNINLREVLKKFGRDVGISLKAIRVYAQQMFLGLSLMRKCNILHADLKPDNMLVNESRNVLKICDLGSASDATENEVMQYLVSRFYRAPEIILGINYDFGIDVWSIGCTLFELYTGKILFTGRSNNQMLRAIMECRGKFSHKMLRRAQFSGYHFDNLLNFRSIEKDKMTGKDIVRIVNFTKPVRDLRTRLLANTKGMNDADTKDVHLFADLLDHCLNLNPEKRCTPAEALRHPFIMRARI